jgi:hypothetical protein
MTIIFATIFLNMWIFYGTYHACNGCRRYIYMTSLIDSLMHNNIYKSRETKTTCKMEQREWQLARVGTDKWTRISMFLACFYYESALKMKLAFPLLQHDFIQITHRAAAVHHPSTRKRDGVTQVHKPCRAQRLCPDTTSLFGWLVADGWCWFVLREEYCWLVAGVWFVVREKYCWLVADKPSEQGYIRVRVRAGF